jgi:UTP--glucose-1-phosphate uridylyltransferase
MRIKKGVILLGGLGKRFFPLSKILPKEFFPLGRKPLLEWILEEGKSAGIKEFIFVLSKEKKEIFKKFADFFLKKMSFKVCYQKEPRGDGDAIFKAKKFIKKGENFFVFFGDDISWGKISMAKEMVECFKNEKKIPLLCLKKVKKNNISFYGCPEVKKIKNKFFKIEKIVEKPKPSEAPSSFAIVGKYILPYKIFYFLKKTPLKKGELILAEALNLMIQKKEKIYGKEVSAKWLECGNIEKWEKSFLKIVKNKI